MDNDLLNNFKWDEVLPGIATDEPAPDDKNEEKPDDKVAESENKVKKEEVKEPEEEAPDKEEPESKEETPEEVQEEKVNEPEEVDLITAFAKDLHELGLYKEVKEEKVDAIDILSHIEATMDERVEEALKETIESWKEGLGEKGEQFIRFTMNGGDPEDFFRLYAENSLLSYDLNSENGQERFLKYFYTNIQGMDKEDAEELVETHKDSEKLEAYAKKYFDKAKANMDKEIQAKLKAQEDYEKEQEREQAKFYEKLREASKTVEQVGKFKISQKERLQLFNYISRKDVKLGEGYVSGFTAELNKLYMEHPEKLLLLAKLIKTDFDVSDLVEEKASEKVQKIKTNLERVQTVKPKTKQPSGPTPVWERDFKLEWD